MAKIKKTEQEWLDQLGPEVYKITRQKGTEYPGTGIYLTHHENGQYLCKCCQAPLFKDSHKFQSHCGWPSFDQSYDNSVEYIKDTSHGMIRVEIVCAQCDAHLGHIFDDGPTETGNRYCVNSASLTFDADD